MGFCGFYRNSIKKPFSLQFIFNVNGLRYINYSNILIILLPDIIVDNIPNLGWGI